MVVGYIDPSFPNPHGPGDASIVIYGYTPSLPLAILAICLFGAINITVSIQILRLRLWTYIPILIGCILEIIGYSFRYMSSHVDPYRISFFVIQYFCITVAPVFITASMYVYMSRLTARASTEKFRAGWAGKLRPRTILWIFVTADVVCASLQVTGAAMIGAKTSKHQDPTTVNNILIAGLAAQTVAVSVFLGLLFGLVIAVHRSGRRADSHVSMDMKKCIFTLCFSGVLIMLRTIFRLCESAQGVFGYLSSHEIFFGVLEVAPVVVALGILALWTPASLTTYESRSRVLLIADQERVDEEEKVR